jgi:hypothetical protein
MAGDHADPGPGGDGQGRLEGRAGAAGDGYGAFGYHPAVRITRGGRAVQSTC